MTFVIKSKFERCIPFIQCVIIWTKAHFKNEDFYQNDSLRYDY